VPAAAARWLAERKPVHPNPDALAICQQRRLEKSFLQTSGFPVGDFRIVHTLEAMRQAVSELGLPVVAKRTSFGYDGKGQAVLRQPTDLEPAWTQIGNEELIIEKFIDFDCEVSVIVARSASESVTYGPIRNTHSRGILDISQYPAHVPDAVAKSAVELTKQIAAALNYLGVLCIEYFVTRDGRVLVNEMAPRPHNSGHLTIEGFSTSQFEQQARAVCGLPLGSTQPIYGGVAMANLLGDLWVNGEPDWQAVLREPHAWLHLYGKASARPGRKMGHLTVAADTPQAAAKRAAELRDRLVRRR
jgi:5-(carboxyamino)imidazole ribonucleotide synthase